jgi:flagellar biogenesis protein FliO
MGTYLLNFIVYTAAMIGVIYAAVFVYKKSTEGLGQNTKSKLLGVEETINLAPRKTLYIIRAGSERFLVAGDVDKTTLISKLDDTRPHRRTEKKSGAEDLPDIIDFQSIYTQKHEPETVFQNMLNKI